MREFTALTKDGNCLLLGYSENTPSRRSEIQNRLTAALHFTRQLLGIARKLAIPRGRARNIKAPEGALIFRSLARPAQRFSNF